MRVRLYKIEWDLEDVLEDVEQFSSYFPKELWVDLEPDGYDLPLEELQYYALHEALDKFGNKEVGIKSCKMDFCGIDL